MKKKYFLMLSLAALLTLGACGKGNKQSEEPQDQPSSSEPDSSSVSYPDPFPPFVDPVVNLDDAYTPSVEISFNQVQDNCMVSPKLKAYLDAMHEQEKTLDKPYHLTTLYGPDLDLMAGQSDKGDGTKYTSDLTGGVDVCQMLNRNDYSNKTENYPIQLSWNNGSVTFDSAKLYYWSKADKSDMKYVDLAANATSASLPNLFRSTKYKVQLVTADEKASNSFEFTTGDYVRTISMGGIGNVRDMGGYVSSYGMRLNQGLIYRGMEIIDVNISQHSVNYKAEVEDANQKYMNIGHEIDLKGDDAFNAGNYSCLKQADGTTPINFSHLQVVAYDEFLTSSTSVGHLPEIFHILANADQEHVYFHCWGGADRTGMVAFFLNAILGVSYTDLIADFEITTETNNKRCHMHNSSNAHFPKFLAQFVKRDGYDPTKSINKNCEKALLDCGVAQADIEKIRTIMLPGYQTGMEEKIPTFKASDQLAHDDAGHWYPALDKEGVKCNYQRHTFGDDDKCSVCGVDKPEEPDPSGSTNPFAKVIAHNWSEGAAQTNSDGKEFIPLTDEAAGKVGVKISINNYTVESDAIEGTTLNSGKIDPVNKKDAILTYRITAPKAGAYQLVMTGKSSSSGDGKTLSERSFTLKLNGQVVDIEDGRAPVTTSNAAFVAAPTVNLTGGEDVIKITCCDYRIQFDTSSFLVFAEH